MHGSIRDEKGQEAVKLKQREEMVSRRGGQGCSGDRSVASCPCEVPANAILWKIIHALKYYDTGRKGRALVR